MAKVKRDILSRETELLKRLLKEQTDELERTRERLFLANQVKTEFMSHMSRELRTPLNNIVDYAGLMQEEFPGTVTDRQRKYLKRILEDSVRVRSMVERILELCSVDIGMSSFSPERFDLQSTLRKILDTVSESAGKKEIAVRINYEEEAGFITADVKKFCFIMEELLTNALKFSSVGSRITVSVREVMLADENAGSFLEISVTDQGSGICREDLERIFAGFEQVEASQTGSGSLGLGLSLVKRLVELHGGKIWVDSCPGEGSTFTFILPKGGILPPESATPRIIMAFADPKLAQMHAHCLREEGYEIITASRGLEVLDKSFASPPDLFLIDEALPEMSGNDVCRQLKSREQTKHIPVLIISTGQSQVTRTEEARIAADGFYTYPYNVTELLARIRSLIFQKLNYEYLRKSYEIAATQACTDPMTGLYNPRYLWHTLEREIERAGRYGRLCSVMMIDIDHFKNYNDMHGHLQGDEILKKAAEIFRQNIRTTDITVRYGGEEFLIMMPETGKELAQVVAEKLRKAFEGYSFPHEESQPGGRLTVSIGIAMYPDDAGDARTLVDKADKALYRAKKGGRNRIVAW